MKVDLVIVNPNDRKQVYQNLAGQLSGIEPPTFALLVAQYVRQKGYSVAVIDQGPDGLTPEEIAREVEYLSPSLVAMYVYGYQPSASTQNMPAARKIAKSIKQNQPNMPIFFSGTHPAALPVQTLAEEPADFVCDREGFETVVGVLQFVKYGHPKIDEIPDLWYPVIEPSGLVRYQFTVRGRLLNSQELDSIGMPAWDLIERNGKLDHYRCHNWHAFNTGDRSPYASMYTSFGCPYKCSFCCINAPFGDMHKGPRPYRLFSPEVSAKQVEHLVTKYGVRNIKFVDEMFVLNKPHVLGFCNEIEKRGLGSEINIWAYARVDQTDDEFLQPMKKAGINWLCLGIESGTSTVRDGANKLYGNDDIKDVVKRIQNNGIYIIGNYIFGLPNDDLASMQNTYDLASELNCEFANFYSAMAYPGSPLFKMAMESGLELPKSWEGYSQHGFNTLPLRNEYCTSAEILKFRDEKHLAYFSRPEYQKMVLEKFGQRALDEINLMLSLGQPKRSIYS